jgi:predicted DNA-binding protein
MIKSGKKVNDLVLLLSKDNPLLISEAIGILRDEEPFEGAIPILSSFYDKTENLIIRKTIEAFMNDLKDQSVTKEVITEIRKPYKQSTIAMLVSSCWQSGLNYSEYLKDLAEIFLSADYLTALECFTVIEESAHVLTRKKKEEIISLIDDYPHSQSNEKEKLANELIGILR